MIQKPKPVLFVSFCSFRISTTFQNSSSLKDITVSKSTIGFKNKVNFIAKSASIHIFTKSSEKNSRWFLRNWCYFFFGILGKNIRDGLVCW